MKKTLILQFISLISLTALSQVIMPFPGYDWLKDHSSDIIIAHCVSNPPPLNHTITSDVNTFSIKIIAAVKGTNYSGSFILNSEQWLNQGDNYLIFGSCENGVCQAIGSYRVIPLGRELWAGTLTNSIAGKFPDEQLQILFKQAIDNANHQIKKEEEEKRRLEGFISK